MARKSLEPWHKTVKSILDWLKDKRGVGEESGRRLNLYTAGYLTTRAILYGKTPKVSSARRWADSEDDVARVAGEMQERMLNEGIASGDGYERALGYVLEDRLNAGMGQARVRYEPTFEPIKESHESTQTGENVLLGEAATPTGSMGSDGDGLSVMSAGSAAETDGEPLERKVSERVEVDYVHWKDFVWSPCRYWEEVRYVAFGTDLGRKALKKRFGRLGESVPLNVTATDDKKALESPSSRARIWEVWDKEEKQAVWLTEQGVVLDVREDPLGLEGFFPCPRPFFGLTTTDECIPRPDFCIAEDLYKDINVLVTRIHLLTTALRVVGMYDKTTPDLGELMNNTGENQMIPVSNWAMFAEKGGLQGSVSFFPTQEISITISGLRAELAPLQEALYQVTGLSDILRGQSGAGAVTATEQRIKANFGSARLQATQDEFANFATSLQRLKAEVIAKHFAPEEIIRQSNILHTPDARYAADAVALLQSEHERFRVQVTPEALAMADFAALKDERMEVVQGVGAYVAAVAPVLQMMPQAAPALIQVLSWLLSGLKGSSEIEGVFDAALESAQAAAQPSAQPQKPDPKVQAQQMKAQADLAKVDADKNAKMELIQAEVAGDAQREATQKQQNVEEALAKAQISAAYRPPTKPGGENR